mgnify:CR=1 FL=1
MSTFFVSYDVASGNQSAVKREFQKIGFVDSMEGMALPESVLALETTFSQEDVVDEVKEVLTGYDPSAWIVIEGRLWNWASY